MFAMSRPTCGASAALVTADLFRLNHNAGILLAMAGAATPLALPALGGWQRAPAVVQADARRSHLPVVVVTSNHPAGHP